MKEKRSDVVEISDLTPKVLSDLLAYIYTGICPNLASLAKELLNAANKYQLPRLVAMCENELELRVRTENVFEYLVLADLYWASQLKATCMRFIKSKSLAVFQSEGWKNFKQGASSPNYQTLLFEILEFVDRASQQKATYESTMYTSSSVSARYQKF